MTTFENIGSFGRFGNQLFQIAAAIGCAKENNDIVEFYPWEYSKYFKNPINQGLHPSHIRSIYNEPHFHYTKIPYSPGLNLKGYFQSWRYFAHCEDVIRNHFEFKDDVYVGPYLEQTKDSCSIHIRRTDYLAAAAYHPFPGMDYYNAAINLMLSKGIDKFMIFSDDIQWCRGAFGNDKKFIYVDGNSNVQDMFLMSKCYSNIIANSSFSFWGAWLNNNVRKMVVAPNKWFGPAYKNVNTNDLYCDTWIRL